jgi:hypothetical protein
LKEENKAFLKMMRSVTVALTIIATFVYSYFEYKYSLGFIILATITTYLIYQGFNVPSTILLLLNLVGHVLGRPFLTLLTTVLLFVLLLFSYRPVVIQKTVYHETKDYTIIEVPAKRRDGEDGAIIVEERLPNISEFHFESTREIEEISEPNELSDILTQFSENKSGGSSKKHKEEPCSSTISSLNSTKKSSHNKENQGNDINQMQSSTKGKSSTSSGDIVQAAKLEAKQAEEERKNKMIDEIYKSPSKDDKKNKNKNKKHK